MKRSNRLILLIGIFLAIVAFIGIVLIFQNNNNQISTGGGGGQPATQHHTVIAKQDIPLGTAITASMVDDSQVLADTARQPGAYESASQAIGQVVRVDVKQGQQITSSTFATGSGATDVTPLIGQGLRAMSIQVDQVSGVGTLIHVGDRVDLVAGISINLLNVDPTTKQVTKSDVTGDSVKLLLQNMQVVGTLLPPPPAQQNQNTQGTTTTPETNLNGQQEIVIVAATAQQAEVIKFAQMDGSIALVLRSPKDFQDATGKPVVPPPDKTTGIVLKTLIDNYGVLPPQVVELQLPPGIR